MYSTGRYAHHKFWGGIDLIIEDAGKRIAELPCGEKRIIEVFATISDITVLRVTF